MRFTALFYLSLLSITYAAIGPNSDLHIVNKIIAPDGFTRSYVANKLLSLSVVTNIVFYRAVLAGSTADNAAFPGPLIRGTKVSFVLWENSLNPLPPSNRETHST